jgi:hypothetical protein
MGEFSLLVIELDAGYSDDEEISYWGKPEQAGNPSVVSEAMSLSVSLRLRSRARTGLS